MVLDLEHLGGIIGNEPARCLEAGLVGGPDLLGASAVTVGAAGSFNPGPSWHIEGTGDFNGDGKSDILWQGDDGTPAIWFMDGMNFLSGGAAGSFNPGPDWHVIA